MLERELAEGLIRAAARRVSDHQDELSRLDAVAGDGDHGVNMATALAEASSRIEASEKTSPADVFRTTGRAFHDTVGGAAGALFGSFFSAIAGQLDKPAHASTEVALVAGMAKGLTRVMRLGRVEAGQKTMVDALAPAIDGARTALEEGASLAGVLSVTAQAARKGAVSTASMEPQAGRARYAADRSIGTEDPGACTVALIFEAWAETSAKEELTGEG